MRHGAGCDRSAEKKEKLNEYPIHGDLARCPGAIYAVVFVAEASPGAF